MKIANVCFDNSAGFINPGEVMMKTVYDWLVYAMEQVMDNNLKFGGETLSRIALGFRKEPTQKRLLIIISTDGLKVPEEFAKTRMFKKGQRAEETADKDGTGFGLYTARQYMRQLGGDMWCEPKEEDEWMSFFIALPLDILE
jgi:signal transduction histidine kinase